MITVCHAEAGARIVDAAAFRGIVPIVGNDVLFEAEPAARRLADHPAERQMRQAVVGIAAADVGVGAGEPDLAQTRRTVIRFLGQFRRLVPAQREECAALIVDGEGLARRLNAINEVEICERQRPDHAVERARQLFDRQTIGRNGVPDTEKMDRDIAGGARMAFGRANLAVVAASGQVIVEPDQSVSDGAVERHPEPDVADRERLGAVGAVGGGGVALQFLFGLELDQPFFLDHADEQAHDEGATAEAEGVDVIALAVVQAKELVEREHAALDAEAERQPEHGERPETRRANAVGKGGELLAALQVERLVEPPYIGLERLGGAVAGAVGENDDVAPHRTAPATMIILKSKY